MSRRWGSAARIRSHGGAAGLALLLILTGCTGSGDPPGANDGSTPPVNLPTGSGGTGVGAVDPGYVYPDPLRRNEVVNGRRVQAGAFPAVWPETSLAEVALAQLATLEGHQTWRLSATETAERSRSRSSGGLGVMSAARSERRSIPGGRCPRSGSGARGRRTGIR